MRIASVVKELAACSAPEARRCRPDVRNTASRARLVKRLAADELILSFVPDVEQRLRRTITRRKYQLTRDKVRSQNQLEAPLEEAHVKLSSLVSDLLGAGATGVSRFRPLQLRSSGLGIGSPIYSTAGA
jgi:hypothetical protein